MFAVNLADVHDSIVTLQWVVGICSVVCMGMLAWVWVRQEEKKRMHAISNRKLDRSLAKQDEMITVVREYLHVAGMRADAAVNISSGARAVAASLVREGRETMQVVKETVKDAADKAAEIVKLAKEGESGTKLESN